VFPPLFTGYTNHTWRKKFARGKKILQSLGGQLELGALWWDMHLVDALVCLFLCVLTM